MKINIPTHSTILFFYKYHHSIKFIACIPLTSHSRSATRILSFCMHSYIAFIGNHPTLSTAEFSALLPDFMPKGMLGNGILRFETNQELDQRFLNKLGGTILLCKKIISDDATLANIPQILTTELQGVKGKAVFALRFIGVAPGSAKGLYMACKKHLRAHGSSSRFVGNERDPAKAIQLHDEGLLDPKEGCELVIVQEKNNLWVGRTVAAQDVKAYTLRDIEKPVRDTTVGLLPPKLAQLLLNFGEYLVQNSSLKAQSSKLSIFDPFCGTGVIPIEAMLRGHHILGSDLSEKAVTGCTKNVEWVRKTFKILKKDVDAVIWKQDATKPFTLKEAPNVIVTEGSLGPALKSRATVKDAESYAKNADILAQKFLKNCSETLKGVPIVMTLPIWYAQKRLIPLEKIWQTVAELGYKPVLPPHTTPTMEGRFSLVYRRADQFVGREIILLKPSGK